jgi:hypothetical protein
MLFVWPMSLGIGEWTMGGLGWSQSPGAKAKAMTVYSWKPKQTTATHMNTSTFFLLPVAPGLPVRQIHPPCLKPRVFDRPKKRKEKTRKRKHLGPFRPIGTGIQKSFSRTPKSQVSMSWLHDCEGQRASRLSWLGKPALHPVSPPGDIGGSGHRTGFLNRLPACPNRQ